MSLIGQEQLSLHIKLHLILQLKYVHEYIPWTYHSKYIGMKIAPYEEDSVVDLLMQNNTLEWFIHSYFMLCLAVEKIVVI